MALVNCRECGKQISDRAAACPHCGFPMRVGVDLSASVATPMQARPPAIPARSAPVPAPPSPPSKRSGCGTFLVLGLVGLLVLVVLGYGMGPSKPTAEQSPPNGVASESAVPSERINYKGRAGVSKADSRLSAAELLARANDKSRSTSQRLEDLRALSETYPESQEAKRADELRPALDAKRHAELNPVGLQWSYSSRQDEMSGKGVRSAKVTSTNSFNFDFPYSGRQRAELLIRRHPRWGNDVVLSIEKGQILCHSYSSCPVRVRFDDEPAKTYTGTEPADNSSDTVFIPGYKAFTSKLAKAKRVRIEFNVYQEGSVMAEFDVSGFDGKKLNQ